MDKALLEEISLFGKKDLALMVWGNRNPCDPREPSDCAFFIDFNDQPAKNDKKFRLLFRVKDQQTPYKHIHTLISLKNLINQNDDIYEETMNALRDQFLHKVEMEPD